MSFKRLFLSSTLDKDYFEAKLGLKVKLILL